MNTYRSEAGEVARNIRWTFWRFLPLFILVAAMLSSIFFGLRSIGLIGYTAVEREVFEQSYQRSEALKSALATYEAQLVEISQQLNNPDLDDNTRYNLNAQKSALNVRINSTIGKMK